MLSDSRNGTPRCSCVSKLVRRKGCRRPSGSAEVFCDEGDADLVRPGTHRNANFQARADFDFGIRRADRGGLFILAASDSSMMHRFPVDRDDHLMLKVQTSNLGRSVHRQFRLENIFSSEREIDFHGEAAARPQGKSFDVMILPEIRANTIGGKSRSDVRIADRQPADLAGGGHVTFEQRRRNPQRVAHVIEAVIRVVRGQQRGGIHIEREKIADRGSILAAVEPPQSGRPGIAGCRRIELRFQPCRESVRRGAVRPRKPTGGMAPACSLRTTFSQISA